MKALLTTMAAILLSAGGALAGERYRVGPMIGTTFGGVSEQFETVYGGQIAGRLDNAFSIELAILHFTDHPEEERLGISVTAALDITPVQLSACYSHSIIDERLDARVLAGIGYTFCQDADFEIQGLTPGDPVTQTGALRVDKEDAIGYQLAGGLEWTISSAVTALLEYRYTSMLNDASISGLSANSPEGQDAIDAFEKDFWDNNELGILRIGLNWRF